MPSVRVWLWTQSSKLPSELGQTRLAPDLVLHEGGEAPLLLPLLPPQRHDALVRRPDHQQVRGLRRVQVALEGQLVEAGFQMSASILLQPVVDFSGALLGSSARFVFRGSESTRGRRNI